MGRFARGSSGQRRSATRSKGRLYVVVRTGQANEYLSRLETAGNSYKAAKTELTRRAEGKRNSLRAAR